LIAHLDPFARVVVTALGLGIVEAAALAVLVAAVARVVHASATTRHVLWWIAFACAALLPVASIAMSFHRIEHVRPPAAAAVAMGVPAAPATYGGALSKAPPQPALPPVDATARDAGMTVGAPDGFALLTGAAHTIGHVRGLASALVAFWLAVAFLRIGMLVPGLFWLIRVKREALPLDESVVRRLRRYRHGSRTGRSATILLSAAVDVPIAVGLGAPAILLPVRIAETESIADLDQIVMHEHAHLNRYDDVTNLIQRVIERLFWFNPAIAYAGTRIALEREIACDDAVVAQTGRAHRYATCLWKLVESARLPAQPVMAPGALPTATPFRGCHPQAPSRSARSPRPSLSLPCSALPWSRSKIPWRLPRRPRTRSPRRHRPQRPHRLRRRSPTRRRSARASASTSRRVSRNTSRPLPRGRRSSARSRAQTSAHSKHLP
jgi:beta-lactamase regulating signal transducer with metallopeptidase domain